MQKEAPDVINMMPTLFSIAVFSYTGCLADQESVYITTWRVIQDYTALGTRNYNVCYNV